MRRVSAKQVLGKSEEAVMMSMRVESQGKITTNSDGALLQLRRQISPTRLAYSEPIIPHDVRQASLKAQPSSVEKPSQAKAETELTDSENKESTVQQQKETQVSKLQLQVEASERLDEKDNSATPVAEQSENRQSSLELEELAERARYDSGASRTTTDTITISGEDRKSVEPETHITERDYETNRLVGTEQIIKASHGGVRVKDSHPDSFAASHTSSPSQIDASPEFVTADFYFDESMPSSYTDSSGGHHKGTPRELVAEIQRQLHDKEQVIWTLTQQINAIQGQLQHSESKLDKLLGIEVQNAVGLKQDFCDLKTFTDQQRDTLLCFLKETIIKLQTAIKKFHDFYAKERDEAVALVTESMAKENMEKVSELASKLELEKEKLDDSEKQVEFYHQKLDELNAQLDIMTLEHETNTGELKKSFAEEREDYIKQMTIEHEIEMDQILSEFKNDVNSKDEELKAQQQKLAEAESKLADVLLQKEQLSSDFHKKIQDEKEQLIKALETDFEVRRLEAVQQARRDADSHHEKKLEECTAQVVAEKEVIIQALKDDFNTVHSETLENMKSEFEFRLKQQLSEQQKNFDVEKEKSLAELEDQLHQQFKSQLENMRSRFKLAYMGHSQMLSPGQSPVLQDNSSSQLLSSSPDSMDSTEQIATNIKADLLAEKSKAVAVALEEQRIKFENDIENLKAKFEKERIEAIAMAKSSTMAERQMKFNEVVVKVTTEKELVITNLKKHVAELEDEIEKNKAVIDKLMRGEMDTMQGQETNQMKPSVVISAHSFSDLREMGASVLPVEERVAELEDTIRNKDEELAKLQRKFMEMSMTVSTANFFQGDRVSFLTCSVGDTVLLCYDDRHEHYVVFNIGTTMHFLHSDCLEALGLKPDARYPRKSWVLAEIVDKEYCQAKKEQNRFKVPLGTKFYRVRAKPWDKEAALSQSRFHTN